MKLSRRDCSLLLLPALMARAQEPSATKLPSKTYRFEDLPVRTRGENAGRKVLEGTLQDGFLIEVHATQLAPGSAPHAPHRHVHEEMFVLREGTLEVFLEGNRTQIGPGGVAFVASNEEHGVRNVGTTPAHYCVVEFRNKRASGS
jgi:quercetin dioxygenase-like cupin family protein